MISRDQLYLGLSRRDDMAEFAQRFSHELRHFKREPAYAALSARYNPTAKAQQVSASRNAATR